MSSTNLNPLFPIAPSRILTGFTTCPTIDLPNVAHVALADKALGVHKVSSQTSHPVVTPPHPTDANNVVFPRLQAWQADFPADSINPGNKSAPAGGFGFYMNGPKAFHERLKSEKPTEVVMAYEVMFQEDWEWGKGGKLPGMFGGTGDSAYGCTGGRQSDRCKCFNLRLMWRENATAELYAYLPQTPSNTHSLLSVPPRSIQHPDYGFSVGRGAWKFIPGRWTAVAERLKMNNVGTADGEIEVYIDGRSVIHATGLIFRDEEAPEAYVQGMHFQTFFGGHSPEWASPKHQRAWFMSISGAIMTQPQSNAALRDEL
ncbi:hypothetical protein BC835DRAFT_510128 [Cytidiella melzeri]|nr:hypothetical protein BC835DRAFT_510128 [Cytidiella melzeri]